MPKISYKLVVEVVRIKGYCPVYKIGNKIVHNETEFTPIIEEEIDILGIVNEECEKCHNKEAYYWHIQTRSGDEAMTTFYRCTKCGYSWRSYG